MADRIAAVRARPVVAVEATTFLDQFVTACRPVLLSDSWGDEYVVKGAAAGRSRFADYVVGRLGREIGAPVAPVSLVRLSAAFVEENPGAHGLGVGIAHGSKWIPGVSDVLHPVYTHVPENRPRYSALALLFGCAIAFDQQYLVEEDEPHLVFSADHGEFFPGRSAWTARLLRQRSGLLAGDGNLVSECRLTAGELSEAAESLATLSDAAIATAVGTPPAEWGINLAERLAIALFLARRRDRLVNHHR